MSGNARPHSQHTVTPGGTRHSLRMKGRARPVTHRAHSLPARVIKGSGNAIFGGRQSTLGIIACLRAWGLTLRAFSSRKRSRGRGERSAGFLEEQARQLECHEGQTYQSMQQLWQTGHLRDPWGLSHSVVRLVSFDHKRRSASCGFSIP